MINILLEELIIQDFRGWSHKVKFNEGTTHITGTNGLRKTTIYEAFHYLLTGVDLYDRANYDLYDYHRTYAPENSIPAIIEGVFKKAGITTAFKRSARQKWVRKRGKTEYVKDTSDEYKFYIDGLEVTASAYKDAITDYFGCSIDKLKLIINIHYFRQLHWKDLRKHFADLVGEVKEEDYKGDYTLIQPYIAKYGSERAKEFIQQQSKPIKEQIKDIDAKIEAKRALLPDLSVVANAELHMQSLKVQMDELQKQILGQSDANKPYIDKRNEELMHIANLRYDFEQKKAQHQKERDNAIAEISKSIAAIDSENCKTREAEARFNREKQDRTNQLENARQDLERYEREYEVLKKQNLEIKAREIDETCPTCGAVFTGEMLEKVRAEFREKNEAERKIVIERAKIISDSIEAKKGQINRLENEIKNTPDMVFEYLTTESLSKQIDERKAEFIPYGETEEGAAALKEIAQLENSLTEIPEVNNADLVAEHKRLLDEIEVLAKIVSQRETHKTLLEAIADLETQKNAASVELAKYDGLLANLMEREREWADIVRQRTASYFERVKVEMLDRDKSGNYVDICSVSIDGVDVGVTNRANKFISGIDISNGFSKKYGISLPLFIDDCEGVFHYESMTVNRQTIILEARKDVTELTIY